jgi:hypothetical protein
MLQSLAEWVPDVATRGMFLQLVARMERKRNPGIPHPHCATLHAGYTREIWRITRASRDVLIVIVASWVRYLPALHFIPIINN